MKLCWLVYIFFVTYLILLFKPGHGGSDGLHGYVHSLDYVVDDLKSFLDKVLSENPGLPCFFFGHSTGAAIVLKAVMAKYSDPLVYTGFIRNLKRLRVPFLVLHGAADTVTDPDASRKLYEEASSTDKTIKLLEGFLHDLLFEPERDEIMKDIIDWLNCRV
ncbi:hypothetical protein POTOM_050217 [Populus tomentosa]|uniref:Serine aminopeptidase S33 domain-containing protein n=1 Tax=Populus tomentosa TaxID=118781 RepID=A0A8X8C7U1_POPTO|nr:hypothetical protein POTOM_050217 [Populus tomentosa]